MKEFAPSYFFNLSNYQHRAIFENVNSVWDVLKKIKDYLESLELGKINGEISKNAFLIDPQTISIGEGSVVEPGAYIKGPCVIGKHCTVRHGAYIRGNLITGDNCVIGHDSEIKNSVFLDGVHAAHFAYVGDSVLGNRVNLGAGTKCANLRLDNGTVMVKIFDQHMDTGLRKFGAIIGDDSQTGCNSVTNPGVLMGKETLCYPLVNISHFIPSKSIVQSEGLLTIKPKNRC